MFPIGVHKPFPFKAIAYIINPNVHIITQNAISRLFTGKEVGDRGSKG